MTSPWKSFIDGQKFLWIRKIQRYIPKSKENLRKLLKFINIEDVKQIETIAHKEISHVSCHQYSILHFSAMTGNTNVFRIIYERSSEKCPKDHYKMTPFHYAAKYGHFDVCQFIIKGTDDQKQINYDMNNVLYMVADGGNFKMFKFIFSLIEDKNPADAIGLTPLHLAAANGHFSICDLILENVEEKYPKIKQDNGQDRTPYDFAKSNGHFKICQLIKNSKDKVDHHLKMLASGDFPREDYEFYEEITDESDDDLETTDDKEVYLELFKGDIEIPETLEKFDQHTETLDGDNFNEKDHEFYEEITDESDADWETIEDEVNSKISEDIENMEDIEGFEAFARIFQHGLEFYEEITDENDTNWETTNNKNKISDGDVEISEHLDKVDQHMETLDNFNEEDYEFYEEITDESDADWETTEVKEVHSKGDVEILETINKVDQPMEMVKGDELKINEDKEVHSEVSKGYVEILETIDMEMLEKECYDLEGYEF